MNFVEARNKMVDGQVRTADVTDLRILAAMLELPRERFVHPDQAALAYADIDLPVAGKSGQSRRCLLRARTLGKLIQAADVQENERVLDIGGTTGYGAAVLARLAREVVMLEEDTSLVALARKALAECGTHNVAVVTGPLTAGWPQQAPYDVILLEGATEVPLKNLAGQLRDGGRLLAIEGRGLAAKAMVYRCDAGVLSGRPVFDAAAPILPGFVQPPAFVF